MKIEIRVDQDRLGNLVTVDDWCSLEEGQMRGMRKVLSLFIVGEDGQLLSPEEGLKVIGALSINQLNQVAADFMAKAKESAAPKASGSA